MRLREIEERVLSCVTEKPGPLGDFDATRKTRDVRGGVNVLDAFANRTSFAVAKIGRNPGREGEEVEHHVTRARDPQGAQEALVLQPGQDERGDDGTSREPVVRERNGRADQGRNDEAAYDPAPLTHEEGDDAVRGPLRCFAGRLGIEPMSAPIVTPITPTESGSAADPPTRRMADMRKSKFTDERVIGFLKQAEAGTAVVSWLSVAHVTQFCG